MQEKNLEQEVRNAKIGMFNEISSAVGYTLKRYAALAAIGTALAVGGSAVGGCGDDESECCAQLRCEEKGNGWDKYTCMDTDNTIYKEELCVTLDDGTKECCRCMYKGSPDPGSKY